MDKLMQAVNDLRGDLDNAGCVQILRFLKVDHYGKYLTSRVSYSTGSASQLICTVKEFNNLVAELSVAEWIK